MSSQSDLDRQLFDAIRNKNSLLVKQLLIDGANIEATLDEEGSTPLHLAAIMGLVDIVKFLVENGANINATNSKGGTTLLLARTGYTLAAKTGHKELAAESLELIQWLREHGAIDTPGTEPQKKRWWQL